MAAISAWEWLDQQKKERTKMVYDPKKDEGLKALRATVDEIAATQLSPERQVDLMIARQHADVEAARRTEARKQAELKQQRQAEARLAERRQAMSQSIRDKFFQRNPHASEQDFARLWPKLWDEALLRSMDDQQDSSMEVERQHPRYNI